MRNVELPFSRSKNEPILCCQVFTMSTRLEPSAEREYFQPPENFQPSFLEKIDPVELFYAPTQDVSQSSSEPTAYAQKYGPSEAAFYKDTGKSGITPLEPPSASTQSFMSPISIRRFANQEAYQRYRINSFTSWELQDSGCWFPGADAKLPDLSGPIHPILAQENWIKVREDC